MSAIRDAFNTTAARTNAARNGAKGGVKVGEVIESVRITKVINGVPVEGVITDIVMGDTPLICKEDDGLRFYLDEKKVSVNIKTVLKTVLNQIRAAKMGGKLNGISTMTLDEVQNGLFFRSKLTGEVWQNEIIGKIKGAISYNDVGKASISIPFTEKILKELETSLDAEKSLKKEFLELVVLYEKRLTQENEQLSRNFKYKYGEDFFKVFDSEHDRLFKLYCELSEDKYTTKKGNITAKVNKEFIPKFRSLLQRLGFKDTPLIKPAAVKPKGKTAKVKQKKIAGTQEKMKGVKKEVHGKKTPKPNAAAAARIAEKEALAEGGEAIGRQALTQAKKTAAEQGVKAGAKTARRASAKEILTIIGVTAAGVAAGGVLGDALLNVVLDDSNRGSHASSNYRRHVELELGNTAYSEEEYEYALDLCSRVHHGKYTLEDFEKNVLFYVKFAKDERSWTMNPEMARKMINAAIECKSYKIDVRSYIDNFKTRDEIIKEITRGNK